MAESPLEGTDWADDELDAIVADYFSMLDAESRGVRYVKAHHNAMLTERIGRSRGSIEFKHQNISAVLDELGMDWIAGYKPLRNYQGALFGAIDRYLTAHPFSGMSDLRTPQPLDEPLFVEPPPLMEGPPRPPGLEELVRKFDPAERDLANRALGRAGEEFVVAAERRRLERAARSDLADRVRWVADEDGDGAGFDVLSFDASGKEWLIEVKTTNGRSRTPFFLSRNEHDTAERRPDNWRLYRVHQFARAPRIFTLHPPLEAALRLRTETWRASFSS